MSLPLPAREKKEKKSSSNNNKRKSIADEKGKCAIREMARRDISVRGRRKKRENLLDIFYENKSSLLKRNESLHSMQFRVKWARTDFV